MSSSGSNIPALVTTGLICLMVGAGAGALGVTLVVYSLSDLTASHTAGSEVPAHHVVVGPNMAIPPGRGGQPPMGPRTGRPAHPKTLAYQPQRGAGQETARAT